MQEDNKNQPATNTGSQQGTGMSSGLADAPPLTYGQKAVGLSFNPSGDDSVGMAKQRFADVIDQANDLRNNTQSAEVKRMCSVAITEAQAAQMWLVKAITWKD